jgi:hypothetical protein
MDTSPRPQARPPRRPMARPTTEIPYEEIEKIERLVWKEARGEGVEGRNAVRGVILNRLASDRFPDSVDGILTADEFEPIREYGSALDIPVPDEDLASQMAEFTDYVQLGEDAVDGRTFFQNLDTTKSRGTSFDGPDPLEIGSHTFTRGYKDQEPVLDTNFSHDVVVTYPDEEMASLSGFAMGGLSLGDATKGITTQEGEKMAKKKFQLDPSKTDPNGDGMMTEMEKVQAEAEQKAAVESGDVELDEADEAIGMNCGGMMAPDEMMDPVSGNDVPLGSSPENVRDDIPAMLSQDEYVLPAHVVKWHGLKHIQDMQSEAEMGLMGMDMMGLIGGQELDEEEPEVEEETSSDDISEEDIDVETPMVEVKDELDDLEYEEVPEESALPGMMKKQKYAFIMS